jgi:hypothetical protein
MRSNRSEFITFTHAATKSDSNFSSALASQRGLHEAQGAGN